MTDSPVSPTSHDSTAPDSTKPDSTTQAATGRGLTGIIPPVITPFVAPAAGSDPVLDLESLDRLVDHLIAAEVDGLFVLGSSGQVAYLTDADRDTVVARVAERAAGRVPVLAGVPDLTAPRIADQARRAEAHGADALVVTAPLYAINDVVEIDRHFRMIAAAAATPVYAYDVPVRVGTKLGLPLLMALAADGVIAGVKDSSGDDVAHRRLIAANRAAGRPLTILTGHEVVCDGIFLMGGDGAVPGLGNVDPAGYVRLWRAAQAGDWAAVRAEQDRLAALFEIAFMPIGRSGDAGGIGAFKMALESLGIIASSAQPAPLAGLTEADRTAIDEILRGVGLL